MPKGARQGSRREEEGEKPQCPGTTLAVQENQLWPTSRQCTADRHTGLLPGRAPVYLSLSLPVRGAMRPSRETRHAGLNTNG